jgi:hypothetical protein
MTAQINPALLGPLSALLGTLIGGGISFLAAMHTQRCQDRLQARRQRDYQAGDRVR